MTLREVLPDIWRGVADHPDWTPEEGWPEEVSWYVLRTSAGAVMVDPLVADATTVELDELVSQFGGCHAVVRTLFWHRRSCREIANRYQAPLLALAGEARADPFDRQLVPGGMIAPGLTAHPTSRADEVCLWAEEQCALLVGDVLLREEDGSLTRCPDTWVEPPSTWDSVVRALAPVLAAPVEHVLVSHGPLKLGGGQQALQQAMA